MTGDNIEAERKNIKEKRDVKKWRENEREHVISNAKRDLKCCVKRDGKNVTNDTDIRNER